MYTVQSLLRPILVKELQIEVTGWGFGESSLSLIVDRLWWNVSCTFPLPGQIQMKYLQVEGPSCECEDEDHAGMGRKGQVLEGTLQLSIPTQRAVPACTMLGSLSPL